MLKKCFINLNGVCTSICSSTKGLANMFKSGSLLPTPSNIIKQARQAANLVKFK